MQTGPAPVESGYRSLFQRIPVALYRSTPDGTWLAVNPAMVEMLRYPDAETLVEEPVIDRYVDPEDRRRFRQELVRDGRVVGFEARLRRRDGTVIWTRDMARAVIDEDGAVMYFEGAMIDVTDEKQAEERLRRQATELDALHETTLGLVQQLEVSRLLDDILARAADLLESEHAYLYVADPGTDELVVKSGTGAFREFIGYRMRRGEGLAGRVWASGEPFAVDDYHRWPNRRPEFEFIRAAVAIPLHVGSEVAGVIGLARTEKARAFNASDMGLVSRFARMASLALTNARLYDEAQRSEHRYRTLVETSSEWIWSMDIEGRHTSSNAAVRDILGYEPDEILGKASQDLMHPDDRAEVEAWLPDAVAERRGWSNLVIRWRHKDGSYRWLESNGVPILDDQGQLVGYWGADRDVTERVRAGEERRRLLAELVRLQEEERKRIATEIHDDPVQAMTAVEMRLESLRRRVREPEEVRALDQLSASVSEAIARLRRLLVELRPPRLDHEGLPSALRGLLDRLRDDTGAAVRLDDRSVDDIPVEARTVLFRVAQEALANIRKHADASHVRVIVAQRNGGVALRIRDDGRGFHPARTKDDRAGHLGLVSMRERAELAGGKFRITSAPDAGTTVDVWVPVEERP
jgi:PAS domain S-box-containing protein